MISDSTFVFSVLAVAAALMASNRVRFDVVALMVVMALMLSGVLTVPEALAGFGSSVVILVAGLLVIGEMLARTGVARAVGDWILKKGGTSETRLLVLIMVGAGMLGAVMSSTAIVAIFIPIVLRIAAETNLNSSRMLLPMSYAALISGMLTLIATTPNIVVHEELKGAGFDGFGFFSFMPVGLAVLAVAVVYILLFGRRLLSSEIEKAPQESTGRSIFDLWEEFRTGEDVVRVRINENSQLAGSTIAQSRMLEQERVRIIGIGRQKDGDERISSPASDSELHAQDVLILVARPQDIDRVIESHSLTRLPRTARERQRWLWEMGGARVLIHPESRLIGKSVRELQFRSNYGLHVLGLRRAKESLGNFEDIKLRSSDSLFVVGQWSHIRRLQERPHDFVVTELPAEVADIVPSYRRMPVALAILVAMVGLTVFDVVPLVAAVLMASLAAVFTRCLTMEDAYRAIHWSSLVLVAGMLPLADALQKTGGSQIVVDALMSVVGDAGPYTMLSVLFFLTAGLGLVLSNTASAVLVAPIAIYAASLLGVSPYPFAVAVLVAASAAYSTPVSTPVVTLVVDPGKYSFTDFLKLGVPLLFLTYAVTLFVAPLIFPFHVSS